MLPAQAEILCLAICKEPSILARQALYPLTLAKLACQIYLPYDPIKRSILLQARAALKATSENKESHAIVNSPGASLASFIFRVLRILLSTLDFDSCKGSYVIYKPITPIPMQQPK